MRIGTDAGQFVNETAAAWGRTKETGIYALAQAVNSLAAADVRCMGVELQIMLSPQEERTEAYAMERSVRQTCRRRGIELRSVKIGQNPLCKVSAVLVSAAGYRLGGSEKIEQPGSRADQEIVLVKWVGMEGMLRIIGEKEDELGRRFSPAFIRQIQSYESELFAGRELELAREVEVSAVHQITEGGILAALWELAKETGRGIEADIRKMSILQETIEVCEHYRLNPYQMTSAGSFLMLTEDGRMLADVLEKNQIRASVIGRMTAGNDKVIHNGEDIRYIDRPAPDEIYKLFM